MKPSTNVGLATVGRIESKRRKVVHVTQVALFAATLSFAASPTAQAAEVYLSADKTGSVTLIPGFIGVVVVAGARAIGVIGPVVQANMEEASLTWKNQMVRYTVWLEKYYAGYGWYPYCHYVGQRWTCDGLIQKSAYWVDYPLATVTILGAPNGTKVDDKYFINLESGAYTVKFRLEWGWEPQYGPRVWTSLGSISCQPNSASDFDVTYVVNGDYASAGHPAYVVLN